MNYFDDTIAAISTPIGQGGIGIVRISGSKSLMIAERVFRLKREEKTPDFGSHSITYGYAVDPSDEHIIDEVLVSVMRSPNSYTKEDVVEINCHGGMVPVRRILEVVVSQGARLAEPGEFTKRAFLNGRINLSQAEAVFDLISARTDEAGRMAMEQLRGSLSEKLAELRSGLVEICSSVEAHIDFPEDEIGIRTKEQTIKQLMEIKKEIDTLAATFQDARYFREGLSVAIVGRPNVGKSSLLNALLKKNRAIVTEIPGTTRDLIEDYLNIKDLPVRIMDTAGIRHSSDSIEKEGIRRSLETIEKADFIIAIVDGSEPLKKEDGQLLEKIKCKNAVVAVNKSDLPKKILLDDIEATGKQYLPISAVKGEGLEELKSAIFDSALKNWKEEREGVVITNVRHKLALERAGSSLAAAVRVLNENQPLEILSIELREALDHIGEITGAVTTEEILDKIFSDFCIGK
jgi:tRNA modification GTPase